MSRDRGSTKEEVRRAVESDEGDDGTGLKHRLQNAMAYTALREHEEMTGTKLATEAGIKPVMVWRYLSGTRKPSPETLYRMARRLMCEPGWLLFGGKLGRPGTAQAPAPRATLETEYGGSPLPSKPRRKRTPRRGTKRR